LRDHARNVSDLVWRAQTILNNAQKEQILGGTIMKLLKLAPATTA